MNRQSNRKHKTHLVAAKVEKSQSTNQMGHVESRLHHREARGNQGQLEMQENNNTGG